jgi:hypothetical protein
MLCIQDHVVEVPVAEFRQHCRYVTKGAFLESAMIMGLPDEDIFDMNKLIRARLSLFCPGQPVALELSKNPTVLVVNDTVFAHGSLLPEHVKHGIQRINAEVAAWMRRDQLPSGGHAPPPFIAMGYAAAIMPVCLLTHGCEMSPHTTHVLFRHSSFVISCTEAAVGAGVSKG